MDEGRKEADKLLQRMEKEIQDIYRQAYQETWQKAQDYMKQFRQEDVQKRQWMQSGKWTNQQYQDWRRSKLLTGKRWYAMSNALAKDFTHSNQLAANIINGHLPEVYAIGHNWGAYETEILHGLRAKISYTLYDRHTVERLIRNKPDLLPKARIDIPKSERWNKQQLNSAVMQGILQGEPIDRIADRLQSVTNMDRNAAIRNARTMTTSAENAGRLDSYREARKKGIIYQKEWIAGLDGRTRDWHLELHGQREDLNTAFVNAYGEIMYPGDTGADPANVYNCRCCLKSVFKGFDFEESDRRVIEKYNLEHGTNISYDDWKEAKKSGKSLQSSKKSDIIKGRSSGNNSIISDNHTFEKIGEINFSDKKGISKLLAEFEKKYQNSNIEHCIVFTTTGEIYEVHGDSYRVNTGLLENKMKGSINEHNHVTGESEYSFSWEDLESCADDGTSTAIAYDEKYRYFMIFPNEKISEDAVYEAYENAKESVNFDMKYHPERIPEGDEQHERIKRACEALGIKYARNSLSR